MTPKSIWSKPLVSKNKLKYLFHYSELHRSSKSIVKQKIPTRNGNDGQKYCKLIGKRPITFEGPIKSE